MFQVGDVIVNKNFRKERYTILEIHPERNSVLVKPFPDVVDIFNQYFLGIDTINDCWDYDDVYYRKLKLKEICSRLGM